MHNLQYGRDKACRDHIEQQVEYHLYDDDKKQHEPLSMCRQASKTAMLLFLVLYSYLKYFLKFKCKGNDFILIFDKMTILFTAMKTIPNR